MKTIMMLSIFLIERNKIIFYRGLLLNTRVPFVIFSVMVFCSVWKTNSLTIRIVKITEIRESDFIYVASEDHPLYSE